MRNAPELLPTLDLYWKCFWDLRRGLGKSQAIRWRDVQYWCDTYGLDGVTANMAHLVTLVLDDQWLSLQPKPKQPGDASDGLSSRNKRR